MKKLTPKQERFCQEYLVDLNATQAAIRSGYSQKTAYSIGQENLNKPEIKNKIEELQKEIQNKIEWTREQSIKVLAKIASSQQSKDNDRINAVKVLNDMAGYNAPTQIEQKTYVIDFDE